MRHLSNLKIARNSFTRVFIFTVTVDNRKYGTLINCTRKNSITRYLDLWRVFNDFSDRHGKQHVAGGLDDNKHILSERITTDDWRKRVSEYAISFKEYFEIHKVKKNDISKVPLWHPLSAD